MSGQSYLPAGHLFTTLRPSTKRPFFGKWPHAALLAIVALALSGCISYESDGHSSYNSISQIRKGHTTTAWLRENLGQPDSRHETESGTEIWHYEFDEREKTRVSLLLVFSVKTENRSSREFFFEINDNIVQDYWRE